MIGLLLRLGWVLYIDPQAENDAAHYRRLAQELADGSGYGEPPRFFKKIFRIEYYLTALPVFIFARRIWRGFRSAGRNVGRTIR